MKKIVFGEMVCRWSQMSAAALLLTFMACSQEKNAAPATKSGWTQEFRQQRHGIHPTASRHDSYL